MPTIFTLPFKSGLHTEQGRSMDFCCQVPTGTGTGKCFAKQTLLNTAVVIDSRSVVSLKALETEDKGDALQSIQRCQEKLPGNF